MTVKCSVLRTKDFRIILSNAIQDNKDKIEGYPLFCTFIPNISFNNKLGQRCPTAQCPCFLLYTAFASYASTSAAAISGIL